MTILLTALALLAAFMVIALFTPVRIGLSATGGPRPERVELWFWRWRINQWRPGRKSTEKAGRTKAAHKKPKQKQSKTGLPSRRRIGPIVKMMSGSAGQRLAVRMMRAISIREGRLHILFGLDDPGLTGLAAGPAYAINTLTGYDTLQLEPDFTQAVFVLDGQLRLESSLARLSGPPLRFLFEPGVPRALWILFHGPDKPERQIHTQTPR